MTILLVFLAIIISFCLILIVGLLKTNREFLKKNPDLIQQSLDEEFNSLKATNKSPH